MEAKEIYAEGERIVYRLGGWLTVANRLNMTPDHLKKKLSGQDKREALFTLRNLLPKGEV